MTDELFGALVDAASDILRDANEGEALREKKGRRPSWNLRSLVSRYVGDDLKSAIGDAIREIVREELDKRA